MVSDLSVDAEALAIFEEQMRLCKVKPGETVVILNAPGELVGHVNALMLAVTRLGAKAMHLSVPRAHAVATAVMGRHPLVGHELAIDTCKQADMVVDLMGLLFSAEQLDIQAAGTRILRIAEPLHILKQMAPTTDLRRRCELARDLMLRSKRMRITSKHGTDVSYGLSQHTVIAEYGYTDEPGRWDHFPSGFVFTQGNDGQVNGKVVLAPGDIICAFKRYVESPVTFTIENGYITRISGEGSGAELIRGYIESFDDPRGFAIAHIGFGLNERARWDQFAASKDLSKEYIMNALSFYGNVLFSTGPNSEFGGDNDTPCHMDLPMRGCSLWLDDTQILDEGRVVLPGLRAPADQAMHGSKS
ncbi:2,5-dihydroxypyridine 5,6-dioxygenase [Pigmentiphaga humi]|uniref:2,5-dihydroxypyridine 5,6-dioxygenase n=1 Tax=Pigmentiphaga humi TaxID=2478468 RepID=A0A3P4B014_9BURK|nr:leucyl aminopeptidase [Pigmentiphaga humi]VCU68906.1 2,5-dihydroxypyridine 5,6-dioxygenase [Pigmentiphaga humi]